jgi:hypothetical protein
MAPPALRTPSCAGDQSVPLAEREQKDDEPRGRLGPHRLKETLWNDESADLTRGAASQKETACGRVGFGSARGEVSVT